MLVSVKPAADRVKSTRVDSMRDSGIMIPSAIRYLVCTQEISSTLADNPAWISDSEAETIWISRIAMNMPKTMATKAATFRNSRAGAGAGMAAAVVIAATTGGN